MYYSTIHSHGWIVLFCAVILGRYYTDEHHVDEDLTAILLQGGWWAQGTFTGITYREMIFVPTDAYTIVASSDMKNSLIIRIFMVSTKTRRLSRIKVEIGLLEVGQVLCIEMCSILPLIQPIMLLLCVDIHVLSHDYTDQHNVDEDIDTIPSQGGSWVWNTGVGAYLRQPDNPLNNTVDTVASKK